MRCRPPSSSRRRARCCAQAVEREPENALAWARLSELEQMLGELARRQERRRAGGRARAGAGAHADGAGLRGADPDRHRARPRRRSSARSRWTRPNPLPASASASPPSAAAIWSGRPGRSRSPRRSIPNNSLLRSYLGKAYFEEKRDPLAAEQFAIAKELDPNDPTPWLYDAIRLQSENRPVEALRNLEKSIELNDNRAVYRSRELLDRGPGDARHQPRPHLQRPRLRAARHQRGDQVARPRSRATPRRTASSPTSTSDPPARDRTRQRAAAGAAPAGHQHQPGAAEPQRDRPEHHRTRRPRRGRGSTSSRPCSSATRLQVNATGLVGNNETFGAEGVASVIYNNVSVSAGAFTYNTDGWRDNGSIDQDIQNVFAQWAITPELNAQAEVPPPRHEQR